MIPDHLIQILRCPQDKSPVHPASDAVVARVNRAVAAGRAINLAGERIERPIEGGLVRAAEDLLYPIVDQIPVMLPEEAIDLQTLGG